MADSELVRLPSAPNCGVNDFFSLKFLNTFIFENEKSRTAYLQCKRPQPKHETRLAKQYRQKGQERFEQLQHVHHKVPSKLALQNKLPPPRQKKKNSIKVMQRGQWYAVHYAQKVSCTEENPLPRCGIKVLLANRNLLRFPILSK